VSKVREEFIPLPVTPVVELSFDLGEDWDGRLAGLGIPEGIAGASVKLVLRVAEERVAELDRDAIRAAVLAAGAVSCRAPVVHVTRRRDARDARHAAELPLEDSLRIFAEEVRAPEPAERVAFAAALAREADAGATE
jgi:hypothetical protein